MKVDSEKSSARAGTMEQLDRELRVTLGRAPVPRMPADFEARLAIRVSVEESSPDVRRWDWLRSAAFSYWILTALATFLIVAETDWVGLPQSTVIYLLVAAISLLLPSVLLIRQARAFS